MDVSDGDLVRLARAGDAQALALLLGRHRAAMHAVAAAVLGAGPDVEDVVQDASLVAIRGLDRIREPALARAWLNGITRNLARARRRRVQPFPTDLSAVPALDGGPEQAMETTTLRDWIWEAIDGLSQAHRDVVVLRYFSMAKSYDSIALALGIPVGTVRSRLHGARAVLLHRLRELESAAHGDHANVELARERLFADIVDEYNRGVERGLLHRMLATDARLTIAGTGDTIDGAEPIIRGLVSDIEAGVRLRLSRVVAGAGLTVVEGTFHNPPDSPGHCPPLTTQIFWHRGDAIATVHLSYAFA